jgi:hypothetical protein
VRHPTAIAGNGGSEEVSFADDRRRALEAKR